GRPQERADRQSANERGGRPVVVGRPGAGHARCSDGPRIATADVMPIPIHATIDAVTRRKSPIVSTAIPSLSPTASPAHAPRIGAAATIGSRPPSFRRMRADSEAWKTPARTVRTIAGPTLIDRSRRADDRVP